jgi:uncharacterized protein (TIGR01370 family)
MSSLFVVRVIEALLASGAAGPPPSVALHYGDHPPLHALGAFDWVVLEPDHVTDEGVAELRRVGVAVFAYLSVGEAHESRPYFRKMPAAWSLSSKRTVWGGRVMDPAAEGWRKILTEEGLAFQRRGFSGLFLDTTDSYQEILRTDGERALRTKALVGWLAEMRTRWPGIKLLMNRGFALFPDAARLVDGVLAESLFASYQAAGNRYGEVKEGDRRWLLARLQEIHDRFHLPVVVVDYVPAAERRRAREVARRIAALGFVPWVTTGGLDRLGLGAIESVPRRVLLVYDGRPEPLNQSPPHRMMAFPLEHQGFALDYMDAATPLPGHLGDEYAGVITWVQDELPNATEYRAWLLRQIDERVPLAIVGRFGFVPDEAFLDRLGLAADKEDPRPPFKIARSDALLGFEDQPSAVEHDVPSMRVKGPGMTAHLELTDTGGAVVHPVVTAPWGGVAHYPYVVSTGAGERKRWILDPFAFTRRALHLEPTPVLDITTENGRRLLTAHIDGDGYLNLAEHPRHPYAAELMLEEILTVYKIPTTVSVIEGEVGPEGLYPTQSPRLEAIARKIFLLPHVEAASHTFSHPFDWAAAESGVVAQHHEKAHLPIPGYKFDLRREIPGSVAYIDRRLLPPGKRTRVLLWSGSAEPDEAAVALAGQSGLFNVNGGSSQVDSAATDSLTEITALARPVGRALQIYAQGQNENNYTNLWHGPFYGYRRAVEAFQQSDQPRRLKPISIYYHFYSAAKPGGLTALKQVYDWAVAQDVLPLYLSEYAERAEDFYRATLARTLDGGWRWKGLRSLRTIRIEDALGWPEPSPTLASLRQLPQGRYATFVAEGDAMEVHFRPEAPRLPHLAWANARVTRVTQQGARLVVDLSGHVPLKAGVAECPAAVVKAFGHSVRVTERQGLAEFALRSHTSGRVVVECRPRVVAGP